MSLNNPQKLHYLVIKNVENVKLSYDLPLLSEFIFNKLLLIVISIANSLSASAFNPCIILLSTLKSVLYLQKMISTLQKTGPNHSALLL